MQKTANGLLRAVAVGGLMLGLSQNAEALVVSTADFDFASGAGFNGTISFSDDFSAVVGVSGVLTGYEDGSHGFTGLGSTLINWVWLGGLDFNPLPNQVATFLMNGTESTVSYTNWISFAYDLSTAPNLLLAPGGTGYGFSINVNYDDPLTSGTLSPVPSVPLPSSILLLLSGIAGIGVIGRSRKSLR